MAQYSEGGAKALQQLVQGLASKMDQDDLLVVYVTGHGKEGKKMRAASDSPTLVIPWKS